MVASERFILSLWYGPSTKRDFTFDIERPNALTCLAHLFLPTGSIMANTRADLSVEVE
jgi:hypothetical protein